MILFLQHIDIEGPDTLGDFFLANGFDIKIIKVYQGNKLPEILNGIEAVVVLGGPMNVYEEDKYSFLKEENVFIQKVLEAQIPYLGICLGAQLLAKACGARVGKSPKSEIGFSTISLTQEGLQDSLCRGFNSLPLVFQWHGDMFDVPKGGQLLAQSQACPHQAFKVGDNAYGLQFHVEITDQSIRDWTDRYYDADNQEQMKHKQEMLNDYYEHKDIFNQTAQKIYQNFLKRIQTKRICQ